MKILLLSDTHGLLDKVYEIYGKLNHIDLIIHCGGLPARRAYPRRYPGNPHSQCKRKLRRRLSS